MRFALALVLLMVLGLTNVAEARRYTTVQNGKEVVAHTNVAPVVVHKVLPPYGLGKHVYAGRAQ